MHVNPGPWSTGLLQSTLSLCVDLLLILIYDSFDCSAEGQQLMLKWSTWQLSLNAFTCGKKPASYETHNDQHSALLPETATEEKTSFWLRGAEPLWLCIKITIPGSSLYFHSVIISFGTFYTLLVGGSAEQRYLGLRENAAFPGTF